MIVGNKKCEEIDCEKCPMYILQCGCISINAVFETGEEITLLEMWEKIKKTYTHLQKWDGWVMNELNKEEL